MAFGDRVGDDHGEIGAVIGHLHIENVGAVEIDAGSGEIDEWSCRRDTVDVDASGIYAFARVAVKIKYDCNAVGNSCRATGCVWSVSEPTPGPESRGGIVLNDEGKAIGLRAGAASDLEIKGCGELRNA